MWGTDSLHTLVVQPSPSGIFYCATAHGGYNPPMSATATGTSVAPARLVSLDVFRGLTVCLMIIVNNSGEGAFRELQHAAWNGWTATDLVFPSFLFITGVSLTFSFSKRLKEGASKLAMLPHIFKRAAIIFFIGLLINSFPVFRLADWRIPGVLQRIAICYLIGSVLFFGPARARAGR